MKDLARITLLFLWLFAILAPNVVTLMDVDNPVMVLNLNEEEQQENGKKTQGEEKIFNESFFNLSLIAKTKKSTSAIHNFLGHKEHVSEILLPPPRCINVIG